jgi:hypothetical protein
MQATPRHLRLFLLAAVLCPAAALAAPAAPPAPPAYKPVTFDDGRGTLEVVERLRFEQRNNNFDFDSIGHSPTDDSWYEQRLRLGLTWKPDSEWSLQVQLQDVREWDSDRPKVPFILGAEGNDALDLRLASVTFGDPKKTPVLLTFGRQVLSFGDERLVGPSEWNNFARTFDAAKAVWTAVPNKTTVTAFLSSVVNIEGTNLGDGWEFDRSSRNDLFGGVNVTQRIDARATFEGYVFWRDKKDNTPIYTANTPAIPAPARAAAAYDIGQDVYTVGARFVRAPKAGDFDAEFEGALQGGHVNRQTTAATGQYAGSSPTLDQHAWAIHAQLGYTLAENLGKPRFDLEYNVASGDTDRTDGSNGSFMTLFPSTHRQYYSLMDVFSWKNLRELTGTLRFVPMAKTTLRIDYHHCNLYTSQDAWYRANGVATVRPLNPAAQHAPSTTAGNELDATFTWAPDPRVAVDAGWSHFYAGAYLHATGANADADFFYVQTSLKL